MDVIVEPQPCTGGSQGPLAGLVQRDLAQGIVFGVPRVRLLGAHRVFQRFPTTLLQKTHKAY